MAFLDYAGLISYNTKVKSWANGTFVAKEDGKGLSSNDFTTSEKEKLGGIESGAQVNVLTAVKVNGVELSVADKAVDVTVPTKVSEVTNDAGYQTATDVENAISNKVAGVYAYKGSVNTYAELPTEGVKEGHVYNIKNADVAHGIKAGDNVAALVDDEGNVTWDPLAGIVDLSGYVEKVDGKGLSSNDFTDELLVKLNGLSNYSHPTHTAYASGLYKVTVDNLGHVTEATAVEKSDITGLGIPGQDTTYEAIPTSDIEAMFA